MEKFSPKKSDKEVTTIRIPKDILDIIDMKSAQYEISRNECKRKNWRRIDRHEKIVAERFATFCH